MKKQKAMPVGRQGSGLIFAVILLFVILAMVVTLSSVMVLETKMSQKTKSSVGAFYNSESGVEWALNKITSLSGPVSSFPNWDSSGHFANCPPTFGTDVCKIYFLDKDNIVMTSGNISDIKAVRSVGTQNTGEVTQRAIEAAVASGGNGCYTSYKAGCTDGPPPTSDCCLSGFTNTGLLGKWGDCVYKYTPGDGLYYFSTFYLPPGGDCRDGLIKNDPGEAHLCCR